MPFRTLKDRPKFYYGLLQCVPTSYWTWIINNRWTMLSCSKAIHTLVHRSPFSSPPDDKHGRGSRGERINILNKQTYNITFFYFFLKWVYLCISEQCCSLDSRGHFICSCVWAFRWYVVSFDSKCVTLSFKMLNRCNHTLKKDTYLASPAEKEISRAVWRVTSCPIPDYHLWTGSFSLGTKQNKMDWDR